MLQPHPNRIVATLSLAAAVLLASAPSGAQPADRAAQPGSATRQALSAAIEALQREQYAQASAAVATLDLDTLSPFERSRVEQIHFNIAFRDKRYDDARAHLQRAVDAGGLSTQEVAQARYQSAQILMAQQRWPEGTAALEEWLTTAAQPSPSAYYLLAVGYYQSGDTEKALTAVNAAIDGMQQPQESWLALLVALYLQQERFQDALPALNRLVVLAPSKKSYWLQLSSVYGRLEDYASSLATLQLANNAGLLTEPAEIRRFADLLLYNRRPNDAARTLEDAIAAGLLTPDVPLHVKLANAWIEAGEFDKAVPPLERAAELAPESGAQFRLGQVHVQRRDWTAAETALGRAMTGDRFEQLAEAQFLMGIALYEQGRLRDAKAWFEQARTSPSDGGVSDTYLDLIAERSSQRR